MRELLAVGLGGFVGALARYLGSAWVYRLVGAAFPWGTLAVNVVGCFALGLLLAVVERHGLPSPEARLFLGIGVLGSFTTFSTFGHETFDLLRHAQLGLALAYALASLLLGVLAVAGGVGCVRLLAS